MAFGVAISALFGLNYHKALTADSGSWLTLRSVYKLSYTSFSCIVK